MTIGGAAVTGAMCSELTIAMVQDPMFQANMYEAVTLICFMNGAMNGQGKYEGEPRAFESAFRVMVETLFKGTKRPFLVLGGNAMLWNLDESFNVFVKKYVKIANSMGVPTFDGVDVWISLDRSFHFC